MKKKLFINVSALLALVFVFAGSAASQTNYEKAFKGYTLFTTLMSNTTYLINMDGDIVHTWQLSSSSAFSTYFLDNGHIFRAASRGGGGGMGGFGNRGGVGGASPSNRGQDANETRVDGRGQGGSPQMQRRGGPGGGGVGAGGKIQEVDWDGNLVWDFEYYTDKEVPHHDITKMPNGNVLIVCWDDKTDEENIAAGRNPEYQTAALPPDCIIEVKPTGKTTGEVVWKWYVWDHLIQDFDPNKPNYGKVAEHPELIDINYSESWADQPAAAGTGQANRGTGGFGGGRGGFGGGMGGGMMGGGGRIPTTDWTHFNAVAYNAELDQIVLCSYTFSEFWIIDHSTTTAEAASHKGGKCGKGGDLLYRWGNPAAYKSGTEADQKLFCPHNAHWIDKGLPGAGHLLIFNNGPNRQDGRYSSVDELVLPMDDKGNYKMEGKTFGPKEPVWSYTDPNDKTDFYATNISGAQRLPNGNTLICVGPSGRFFEVTSDKEIVWDYRYSSGEGAGENMINGIDVGSMIFRAYRIAADHPGLAGKGLVLKK